MLIRRVEVFQWVEHIEHIEERKGDMVRRGKKYSYNAQWCSNYADSSNFKDKKYDLNKMPNLHSETFWSPSKFTVGPVYQIDKTIVERIFGET